MAISGYASPISATTVDAAAWRNGSAAEFLAVPHRAPHDLAEHIAAPLVRRGHAVADEEGHGAQMVGDDAHRHVGMVTGLERRRVATTRALADRLEDRGEEVRVVRGQLALNHRGDAFEAHAGVDARRGQLLERAVRLAVELHEDVVPDLDVAVAAALDAAAHRLRAGNVVAAEIVDFRARAARPGVAHLPEVVGEAEFGDPVGRHQSGPDVERRMVARNALLALEDAGKQALRIQFPDGRQQLPRKRQRVFLEIVAERKVAEHLEERVMPERRPDVVEVVVLAAHAHALLRCRRSTVVAPFLAEEHVLELVHSRVGEQQRRIVGRDQGGRGHDAVAVPGEIVQKTGADVTGSQHEEIVSSGKNTDENAESSSP